MLRLILFVKTFLIVMSLSEILIEHKANSQFLPFGRAMRKEFLFNPQFISLNHGSFGTYPKAVQQALQEFQNHAEANIELWLRRDADKELDKVLTLLAKLVNSSADDIVMVPDTTNAISAIFRSIAFARGERILQFSTIYGNRKSLIEYICDSSNGAVSTLTFNVTYPISNDRLVRNLQGFLQKNDDPTHPIRIALLDHMSVPGAILPVERIIPLLKARNITVLLDGSHDIGQIPINITELAPDYYITNCCKWLLTAKGSAMMYVDKKHQGTIHPTQINSAYRNPSNFQLEFHTEIINYAPYMTIPAALRFRQDIGGEEAIIKYTHRLAVDGGTYVANLFRTEILQDNEQIASMVDVRLPINNPDNSILNAAFWVNTLLDRFPYIYAPVYKHGGHWWIRMSAEIYNDLDDFKILGDVFSKICKEINANN